MIIVTGHRRVVAVLPGDWVHDALCTPAVAWEHYATAGPGRVRAAARCVSCPVMDQCRQWAVRSNERHGIWAGTTPAQRAVLHRRWLVERT